MVVSVVVGNFGVAELWHRKTKTGIVASIQRELQLDVKGMCNGVSKFSQCHIGVYLKGSGRKSNNSTRSSIPDGSCKKKNQCISQMEWAYIHYIHYVACIGEIEFTYLIVLCVWLKCGRITHLPFT